MNGGFALLASMLVAIPLAQAQAPDLSGNWTGQLFQPGSTVNVTNFPFEMVLTEAAGGSVAGVTTSHAVLDGVQYSASFNLSGTMADGTFSFQDQSFLAGTPAPENLAWCTISGTLAYSSSAGMETLSGPWQAPRCDPGTGTITVTRSVSTSQPSGAVVNGASFLPGVIVANSWITIQGQHLATATDIWDKFIVNGILPTTIDGVAVTVGGLPAYIYYVSPTQINAVAPDVLPGPVSVVIQNSSGTAMLTATGQDVNPAFFLWAGKYAVATRADFSLAAAAGTVAGATTTPAKPGDVIILWGTGFGDTLPLAPSGIQIPADTSYPTASPVGVTVDEIPATVIGAALAPGYAGLYQVAIQIPATAPDGDLPVIATVNGVQSPGNALISVHH